MANGEDWLMRPVVEGILRYESLLDCSVGLEDVARLNDALDVKYENEYRMRKRAEES